MPIIHLYTKLECAANVAFDPSRSVDLNLESTEDTGERVFKGRASGLLALGDSITWEAKHFGVRQRLTSKIIRFDPPRYFRDSMVDGIFKRFDHEHYFETVPGGTRMIDVFDYTSPLGFLGDVADAVFLERYMTRLLERRNVCIVEAAKGNNQVGTPC